MNNLKKVISPCLQLQTANTRKCQPYIDDLKYKLNNLSPAPASVVEIEVTVNQPPHSCSGQKCKDCRKSVVEVEDHTNCKTFFMYLN